MTLSPTAIRENAYRIGRDEKDGKRIARAADLLAFAHERDSSQVIKNGAHNICRFRLMKNKEFAPWLARHVSDCKRLGIYMAKRTSGDMDIRERMAIAADAGRIPQDVSDVAVIRNRNADDAFEYVRKAEREFGCEILLVHDESGKRDAESLLRASELRVIEIPDALNDGTKCVQFIGELPVDRVDIERMYLYNAVQVCRGAITSVAYAPRNCIRNASPEKSLAIAKALSCGHETYGVSSHEYERDNTVEPRVTDNASYNIPYDFMDRRVFAFPSSNPLLRTLKRQLAVSKRLDDVGMIWGHVSSRHLTDDKRIARLSQMLYHATDEQKCVKLINKLAHDYGIDCMVDSYYAGVPLEDILA